MKRLFWMILPLALVLAGCCMQVDVYAPGATGIVVDAETGRPIRDARITRPAIEVSGHKIPAVTTLSGWKGRFKLSAYKDRELELMCQDRYPESISGKFIISAKGYATSEVECIATKKTSWRVQMGVVKLKAVGN